MTEKKQKGKVRWMSITDKLTAIRNAVNLRGKSVTIEGESMDADEAMVWCIETLRHLLNYDDLSD